ncbi:MAG TPA: tRNA uridine-5-carboxymethylaminomethyl(34) synthesis GTPase MnmE [Firmicutes bacterium]|nr:tRNA uridine-5-carboxymethylaminomethyl(34) synthesis GTPase MnmE [Bacillota bacterium]
MEKTIAAISTPHAVGGISVIRISGGEAIQIADRVFRGVSGRKLEEHKGYTAAYGQVCSGGRMLDEAVALVFRAPKSYTGEDVVELSCHGGLYNTREVLRAVLDAGASPAGPGEFTRRAFLHGKIGLTQAEAVAELIQARNGQAVRAALAMREGRLFEKITAIKDSLLTLAGHLSAWVDYPEEEIPEIGQTEIEAVLVQALEKLTQLLCSYDRGRMLREGVDTVIVGKPNVGKSTLMNQLAGFQKSIVTDIAGTTRDIVEEIVDLGDLSLRLADTAGIRQTEDPVEKIGVDFAKKRLQSAQLVLAVFDSSESLTEEDLLLIEDVSEHPCIAVVNKSDLETKMDLDFLKSRFSSMVFVSAKEETGMEELRREMIRVLRLGDLDASAAMLFNERQRSGAQQAVSALQEALDTLRAGMTLDAVTVSVESALESLMELTGEKVSDRVVDEVFSHFCVGK